MLFGKPKHGSLAINVANCFDGICTDTFACITDHSLQLCCVHGKADESGEHVRIRV